MNRHTKFEANQFTNVGMHANVKVFDAARKREVISLNETNLSQSSFRMFSSTASSSSKQNSALSYFHLKKLLCLHRPESITKQYNLRRWNVTTPMAGLKNSHICKNLTPKIVNPRDTAGNEEEKQLNSTSCDGIHSPNGTFLAEGTAAK